MPPATVLRPPLLDAETMNVLARERAVRCGGPTSAQLALAIHTARSSGWTGAAVREYLGGLGLGTESELKRVGRRIAGLPTTARSAILASTLGYNELVSLMQLESDAEFLLAALQRIDDAAE